MDLHQPRAAVRLEHFVRDMDGAIGFYRLLGLDVPDAFEWPPGSGAKHAEVPMPGGHYLAFDNYEMARIWNTQFDPERGEGNIVVGMLVDTREDVDRIYPTVQEEGHRVGQPAVRRVLGLPLRDRDRPRRQRGRPEEPGGRRTPLPATRWPMTD